METSWLAKCPRWRSYVYERLVLIAAALYHRRPVYMAFPTDYATAPVAGTAQPIPDPKSDPNALAAAVKAVRRPANRDRSAGRFAHGNKNMLNTV